MPPQSAAMPGAPPVGAPPQGPAPQGGPPAGGPLPAGDPARGGPEDESQPTQQWSGAPPAWTASDAVQEGEETRQAPPARAWELSDTGHSIPPYPSLPEPAHPPRRIKQGLVLGLLVAVLLAAIVGFIGFVTPGYFLVRVLDPAAVQTGVQKVLTNDYGMTGVDRVICGEGNKVVPNATFDCRASVGGEQVTVPIRITSDAGDYEVGRPTPG
jgi:Domain of unknown function (DUF4333)